MMRVKLPVIAIGILACSRILALEPLKKIDVLKNGDFHCKSSITKTPLFWRRLYFDSTGLQRKCLSSGPESNYLILDNNGTKKALPLVLEQQLEALAGNYNYAFQGKIKTLAGNAGAVFALTFMSGSGKTVKYLKYSVSPSRDGKNFSYKIAVPANVSKANITLQAKGTGKLSLSNLKLERLLLPYHKSFKAGKVLLARPLPADTGINSPAWTEAMYSPEIMPGKLADFDAVFIQSAETRGNTDLAYTFAVGYDQEHLRLLVKVIDDKRVSATPIWMGDSIQIVIDPTYARTSGRLGRDDIALGFDIDKNSLKTLIEKPREGFPLQPGDIAASLDNTKTGYNVRISIPWDKIGMKKPGHGAKIGFDISVNDSDGQGRKWAEWTPGIAREKNPAAFGTVYFLERNRNYVIDADYRDRLYPELDIIAIAATRISPGQEPRLSTAIDKSPLNIDQQFRLSTGINIFPTAFSIDALSPGKHVITAEIGAMALRRQFQRKDYPALERRIAGHLHSISDKIEKLKTLLAGIKKIGADGSAVDASLAVAECFYDYIRADAMVNTRIDLAQREAVETEAVLDEARRKACTIIASPSKYPSFPPPDALEAVMTHGVWQVKGRPVFFFGINQFYHSLDYIDIYKRIGCNLLEVWGGSEKAVFKHGPQPDFTNIDRFSVNFIRLASKDGLRSYVLFTHDKVPPWMRREYPEIDAVKGQFMGMDIDNPHAAEITSEFLKAVTAHMGKLPGILCCDLWNECSYTDVSPLGVSLFREEMKKRYGSIDRLNKTWGTRYNSFAQVIPRRTVGGGPAYVDWAQWNDKRTSDFINQMNASVKQNAPQLLTNVKIPNERVLEGRISKSGGRNWMPRHNNGIDRWLLSRKLDISGCDTRPTPLSIDGKYAFAWRYPGMTYDLQRSIAPDKPIVDSEWHGIQTVYYHSAKVSPAFLNAALWFSYLHGVDADIVWWWSRKGVQPQPGWFTDSLLTRPALLNALALNNLVVQKLAEEVRSFQCRTPEIRILYSKTSARLSLDYLEDLRKTYAGLNWTGQPYGFVTEEMLMNGFNNMKLLVIPDAEYSAPGVAEKVLLLMKRGIKIGVTSDKIFTMDQYGRKIPHPVRLNGCIKFSPQNADEVEKLLSSSGITPDVICIGDNGINSYPVEFRTCSSGSKTIGYYIGLGKSPEKLGFYRNGKIIKARSLITGKQYAHTFIVKPYDFDMIEFQADNNNK